MTKSRATITRHTWTHHCLHSGSGLLNMTTVLFWHHLSGHPHLHGPINLTDDSGEALGSAAGGRVSPCQSCPCAQRYSLGFLRHQGYPGSACMKNETQRNRNTSSKLIWLPRSAILQSVSSEGVSSPRSLSSSLYLLSPISSYLEWLGVFWKKY